MPKIVIYPCRCPEGHHLTGRPLVESADKAEAETLVATLAYTYRPDGLHAPPVEGSTPSPEDPANAGSPDS